MQQYLFNEEEHLHLLEDKPLTGTSSVMDVLYKPLAWWASGKACEIFGWKNPKYNSKEDIEQYALETKIKIEEMELPEYVKLLDKAYRAHDSYKKERAESGTNLHAELERYIKWKIKGGIGRFVPDEKIVPFIEWSDKNVKRFIASEANCFSERLWIGGITDGVAELNDGTLAIIDFKSAKEAYPTHFLQTALYAIQIEENGLWDAKGIHNKKLDKKFESLVVVPFGAEIVKPEMRQYNLVDEYKKGGEWAVSLYRLLGLDKKIKEINK